MPMMWDVGGAAVGLVCFLLVAMLTFGSNLIGLIVARLSTSSPAHRTRLTVLQTHPSVSSSNSSP